MSNNELIVTATARRESDGEIPIAALSVDVDGDGQLDAFEKRLAKQLKAADKDGSGTLDPTELVGVLRSMVETEKANKRLNRLVALLFALVVLLITALTGTAIAGSVVGGNAIKEDHTVDCSDSNDPRCDGAMAVHTMPVESFAPSIFDLVETPIEQLAYLRDLTMYIDLTSKTGVARPVQATFKIAGAYKASSTSAYLVTTNGYTITLDKTAGIGTIAMDGGVYPVSEEMPSGGRRLEVVADAPMTPTYSHRELAVHHESRRRKLNAFSGALMTSGSFTMMSGGGARRRKLNAFGGALMTSGAFTMMSGSGV